jgi:hypothetical protein
MRVGSFTKICRCISVLVNIGQKYWLFYVRPTCVSAHGCECVGNPQLNICPRNDVGNLDVAGTIHKDQRSDPRKHTRIVMVYLDFLTCL